MTHDEFAERLETALGEPMTLTQRTFIDTRVGAAIARAERRSTGWRRLTTRTALQDQPTMAAAASLSTHQKDLAVNLAPRSRFRNP